MKIKKTKLIVLLLAIIVIIAGGTYYFGGSMSNVCSGGIQAKREAPEEIKALVYDGIRYEAPHFGALVGDEDYKGSHIVAYDEIYGQKLWDKEVYKSSEDQMIESDVCDFFITKISIKSGNLAVKNENGDEYILNPRTGELVNE